MCCGLFRYLMCNLYCCGRCTGDSAAGAKNRFTSHLSGHPCLHWRGAAARGHQACNCYWLRSYWWLHLLDRRWSTGHTQSVHGWLRWVALHITGRGMETDNKYTSNILGQLPNESKHLLWIHLTSNLQKLVIKYMYVEMFRMKSWNNLAVVSGFFCRLWSANIC